MEIADLFRAYFDCRQNKRKTRNATAFELEYETNLFRLYEEIVSRKYRVGHCVAFVVEKPVKREIFAGDFRDRVVHHYVVNELGAIFERTFINDSYACREGKGALFGIRRAETFIRSCTDTFKYEAHVLKLDVSGFFMSINRPILLASLERVVKEKYRGADPETLLFLLRTILANDPTENCVIRGSRSDWDGLPRGKSLFHSAAGTGLPIGNLTSQIFANLYLHPLDEFVKRELKVRHYGRYVDDFLLIHRDREFLVSCISKIRDFLRDELLLELHPKKIMLRPVRDGFPFLWGYVKPYRTYLGNRTKGNFSERVAHWNAVAGTDGLPETVRPAFLASVNSYLGLLGHFDAFRIRKKYATERISPETRKGLRIGRDFLKLTLPKGRR